MPIYDYRCECGNFFEALSTVADRHNAICSACGKEAIMKIATPHISLDGTDPSFPGEYMKWGKKREQHMKLERKREE